MLDANPKITPNVVRAVREAVDIVDIAADLTRLQKRGGRYLGLCPFHKEKTPSFSVDPNQGLFYCFGCGAGGDAIKLFMHHSGDDFPAAIEQLARRYNIPLETSPQAAKKERDPRAALSLAAEFFSAQLTKSPGALRYLQNRQISAELRERFGLGYAPDDWRQLLQALKARVPLADLEAVGLVARSPNSDEPYDRFRHRLMFPIASPTGQLLGFGGRTLGDDRAKYLNTAETAYFHKSFLLYGLAQAKRSVRDGGRVLLVEGYFDVLGSVAAGLDWTVASMGTALTPEQARLLARHADEVIVAYDGDEAGERAFIRALPLLLSVGLKVRRAQFPPGHDPDSLRLEQGVDAVRQVVEAAEDAVRREVIRQTPPEVRHDPSARSQATNALRELLRAIPDEVVRLTHAELAAERLRISLDLLLKRSAKTAPAPSAIKSPDESKPRVVRTEEERAICLLLQSDHPLPPVEQLPPDAVFFDPHCRNIYAAFRALYREGGTRRPSVEQLLSNLDREGGTLDHMARLLLEETDSQGEELPQSLQQLERRWRRLRQPELMQQIAQAQAEGDATRLERLLEEKKALTRSLHPNSTGNLW